MKSADQVPTPSGHTPDGGVLVGNVDARMGMVLFEDPQCPYCRHFEELNGSVLTSALEAGGSRSNTECAASWVQSPYGRTMLLLSRRRSDASTSSAVRCRDTA